MFAKINQSFRSANNIHLMLDYYGNICFEARYFIVIQRTKLRSMQKEAITQQLCVELKVLSEYYGFTKDN